MAGYEWLYDAASRIIEMKSAADATTGNTWGVVDYTYDNTDQLQTATYTTFANGLADEDYGYDANGNRNTNGNTVEATGDNRQATDSSGNAYTYDSEGNRLTRTDSTGAVTEYEWDYRNRLTKVTFKDNSAEHIVTKTVDYAYDVMNRLVKETVTVGAAVTQTVFVYDGIESVLQFEKTGSGDVSATDLAHRYLWGSAVDQILASESPLPLGEGQGEGFDLTTPGTVRWSLTDHQGSVRDIVDNVGTVADHRIYDSFGKPTSTPATDFIFGYTGKMYDSATNLQNNLNRWYDPSVGRWLSEDPVGFAGGDVNVNRYCSNSPVSHIDTMGLEQHRSDDEKDTSFKGTIRDVSSWLLPDGVSVGDGISVGPDGVSGKFRTPGGDLNIGVRPSGSVGVDGSIKLENGEFKFKGDTGTKEASIEGSLSGEKGTIGGSASIGQNGYNLKLNSTTIFKGFYYDIAVSNQTEWTNHGVTATQEVTGGKIPLFGSWMPPLLRDTGNSLFPDASWTPNLKVTEGSGKKPELSGGIIIDSGKGIGVKVSGGSKEVEVQVIIGGQPKREGRSQTHSELSATTTRTCPD